MLILKTAKRDLEKVKDRSCDLCEYVASDTGNTVNETVHNFEDASDDDLMTMGLSHHSCLYSIGLFPHRPKDT